MVLRHLPNVICVLRIVMTVPTVVAIDRGEHLLALVIFSIAAISDGLAARGVCERQRHFVDSPIVGQLEWDGREGALPPLSVLRRHEVAPLPFTQRWAIHWIKYAHRHGWQPLLDTRTVKAEVTCMGCCRAR